MTATTTTAAATTTDLTVVRADGTEVPALTTAELSVIFNMTPRRLRRIFRAANVGVGKGSIYATTADDVQAIIDRMSV